jgi:hypothetical protein
MCSFAKRFGTFCWRPGYPEVEVAATVRHALAKIRYKTLSAYPDRRFNAGSDARRLAAISSSGQGASLEERRV